MGQIAHIVGVPGVGKSTLAHRLCVEAAIQSQDCYAISIDLFKDGLRFILRRFPEATFKGFEQYPPEIFLQTSKRLPPSDAMLAAEMKGQFNEVILNTYSHLDALLISEGFYIPMNDSPIVFLERDSEWLKPIHQQRMIHRHGIINDDLLQQQIANILESQRSLKIALGQRRLLNSYSIPNHSRGARLPETYCMESTRYINPLTLHKHLFNALGIPHLEKYLLAFESGVSHGWHRTM